MDPGQVTAETRRTCVSLAVTGSLLVMTGIMFGFAALATGMPTGWPAEGVIAWGLVAAGMCCGVLLIAASRSPARGGGGRRRRGALPGPLPAETVGRPGTSAEWVRGLRPDAPPHRGRRYPPLPPR